MLMLLFVEFVISVVPAYLHSTKFNHAVGSEPRLDGGDSGVESACPFSARLASSRAVWRRVICLLSFALLIRRVSHGVVIRAVPDGRWVACLLFTAAPQRTPAGSRG